MDEAALIDDQPLTAPARVKRALTFWGQVVPILGAYKAVELAQEYGESLPAGLAESLNLPVTEEAAEAKYEELHDWGSVPGEHHPGAQGVLCQDGPGHLDAGRPLP